MQIRGQCKTNKNKQTSKTMPIKSLIKCGHSSLPLRTKNEKRTWEANIDKEAPTSDFSNGKGAPGWVGLVTGPQKFAYSLPG